MATSLPTLHLPRLWTVRHTARSRLLRSWLCLRAVRLVAVGNLSDFVVDGGDGTLIDYNVVNSSATEVNGCSYTKYD